MVNRGSALAGAEGAVFATVELAQLQQGAAGDARLDTYQRQLADAYLRRGPQALQAGDLLADQVRAHLAEVRRPRR